MVECTGFPVGGRVWVVSAGHDGGDGLEAVMDGALHAVRAVHAVVHEAVEAALAGGFGEPLEYRWSPLSESAEQRAIRV